MKVGPLDVLSMRVIISHVDSAGTFYFAEWKYLLRISSWVNPYCKPIL